MSMSIMDPTQAKKVENRKIQYDFFFPTTIRIPTHTTCYVNINEFAYLQ